MRLIPSSADFIWDVAFHARTGRLTVLGERAWQRGFAIVELNDPAAYARLNVLRHARATALSPDGNRIAGVNWKGNLICRDLVRNMQFRLNHMWRRNRGLTFSFKGDQIFAFGDKSPFSSSSMRWSIGQEHGVQVATVERVISAIAAHPDGKSAALYGGGLLEFLDFSDSSRNGRWQIDLHVGTMRFASDGQTLALTAGPNVVLWDMNERRQRLALIGHSEGVGAVAFTPNGRLLATGGLDRTLKMWDVSTGRVVQTYHWPIGQITAVAFAQDGLTAAAGSNSGDIVVWDVDND